MIESANILLVNRAIISDENRVLIVQRAHDDPRNSSQWEFPGGKIDAGETLEEGLIREIFEETGLLIRPLFVAHVESELAQTGKYKDRLYVALFHTARILEGTVILSEEHEAANWIGLDEAAEHNLTIESRKALESFRNLKSI